MREIKFRAWDKKRKCFRNDLSMSLDGRAWAALLDDSDNYILMQFTGLKDKNGKEIYEGDIVRFTQNDGTFRNVNIKNKIGFIAFESGSFWAMYDKNENPVYQKLILHVCSFEVIGNIYENSELLQGRKGR